MFTTEARFAVNDSQMKYETSLLASTHSYIPNLYSFNFEPYNTRTPLSVRTENKLS